MEQEWFWSEDWQKKEAEVDDDIKNGRIHIFPSVEELIDFLDSIE